jgi:NAD(P)-dependent dehydrogenase (short-subunit alcohol dehydrogenase family)
MSMTGNRVLLVGGTSGLGLAVARAVAERGAQPIVASRRQASVDRAVSSLPAGAAGYTVDIASEDSLAQLVSTAGAVDHLVYTAGEALQLTHLADLTPEVIRRFWETRYIGAISVVRAVVMPGALKEGGSIVLTGGNAGQRPPPGWALGASICGAMEALTRELALELAPIRVNLVAPGVTRSPLWGSMTEDEESTMYASLASQLPVGRVGEPDDIALAYVYAMQQPMATGTSITVDGGAVLV